MASGEVSPLSTEAKFGDTAVHLKDFASKHPLPNVIKITKGQYRNIGVAKSVYNELYIHSIRTSKKVLTEGIRIKDGRRSIQTIDQKFSLPLSYQGWFELLSEDGKPIKAILSVQELVKVFPNKCLVRENIKGFLPKDNGELAVEKARVVHTGEQLTLVGEVTAPFQTPKGMFKKKILKCMDLKEEPVFFLYEQRGLFSPIAGTGNISGVHNIKGLLEKFRLPIMVRLVHGIIPTRMDKNSFTGVFRLLNLYTDETAFVCPLKKDAKMVPISTREPLKIVPATNFDSIRDLDDSKFYHQRCTKMIASYNNSIHILINMPDPQALKMGKQELVRLDQERRKIQRTTSLPPTEENILFEEVDDIYAYVRDGGAPPPPRPRPGPEQANGMARIAKTRGAVQVFQPLSPKRTKSAPSGPAKENKESLPAKAAASPPPKQVDHSMDEDYWEEPIYDDIEKYQRRKSDENFMASGAGAVPDPVPKSPTEKDKSMKRRSFAEKLSKWKNRDKDKPVNASAPKDIPGANKKTPNRSISVDNTKDNANIFPMFRNQSSDSLNKLSDSPKESKKESQKAVAEYIRQLDVPNLRHMYKNNPNSDGDLDNSGSHQGSTQGSHRGSYMDDRMGSSEEDLMAPPHHRGQTHPHDSNDSIPSPASRSSAGSPTSPLVADISSSKPAAIHVIPNRNIVTVTTPVTSKQGQQQPPVNNAKVNIILPTNNSQSHKVYNSPPATGAGGSHHMVFNKASNQISISTPTKLPHRYVAVAKVGGDTIKKGSVSTPTDNYHAHNTRKIQNVHL